MLDPDPQRSMPASCSASYMLTSWMRSLPSNVILSTGGGGEQWTEHTATAVILFLEGSLWTPAHTFCHSHTHTHSQPTHSYTLKGEFSTWFSILQLRRDLEYKPKKERSEQQSWHTVQDTICVCVFVCQQEGQDSQMDFSHPNGSIAEVPPALLQSARRVWNHFHSSELKI